jgi:hypothetical protein
MKFATDRPYFDPEKAARKLIEIANSIEPVQDGRIYIELINWPFLHDLKGTPAEYKAGLDLAIKHDWLWLLNPEPM